ncbi:MAG: glycogen synthase GlgA [Candidatus Hydrogenedentes bacterium]|nr:glycogen synthase GlgA [Candidatus Hydrogenedentota bacterium]
MEKTLRILFVTSELTPLVSTGGLAEVAAALPRALHAQGHDVRVAMPCYQQISEAYRGEQYCLCQADYDDRTVHGALRCSVIPDTDIPLYLVEHEGYFGREAPYGTGAYEYEDNAERFCFFCLALLHAIPQTGWKPDIIHCHDWHTAAIPTHLKTRYRDDPYWGTVKTLFTIHNLAYQGRYDASLYGHTGFPRELFHTDALKYKGDMNLMKGALTFSDKLSTVSPRYAQEIQTLEYGAGLHDVLSTRSTDLHGILNGVDYDIWNPKIDPHIAANYDQSNLRGKDICKATLQKMFGLPVADVPLFGIVSRLHWQKGIDLLVTALKDFMQNDLQLIILGTGDPTLEDKLRSETKKFPEKLGVYIGFDSPRSHAVQAGSDFFLMPSRYEPCGLGQLYAMAYGSIPLVRRTGGLVDSVHHYHPLFENSTEATGIAFLPMTHQALTRSIQEAVTIYKNKTLFQQLRSNGMKQRYSWKRASNEYIALYNTALGRE